MLPAKSRVLRGRRLYCCFSERSKPLHYASPGRSLRCLRQPARGTQFQRHRSYYRRNPYQRTRNRRGLCSKNRPHRQPTRAAGSSNDKSLYYNKMEDNPWKKQMGGGGSVADNPWKKQMGGATSTPGATNPPPAPPSVPSSGPSWMKTPGAANTGATDSSAGDNPWKRNAATVNPAPPAPASGGGPSWAKPSGAGGGSTGFAGFGASKIESMKEKKEREEKEKAEKEQKEREEKERQEKEEREKREREEQERRKEKELNDEDRERNQMNIEDQISKERERIDLQEQAKRKKDKKKPAKTSSPKKNVLTTADRKPKKAANTSSPQRREVIGSDPLAERYVGLFDSIFQRCENYHDRLDAQKQLMQNYKQFKTKCSQKFKQRVDESLSEHTPLASTLTEDCITYTISLVSSKLATPIPGSNNLPSFPIYNSSLHKNLKQLMKSYQAIQNGITSLLKSLGVFRLRTPLCVVLEYRGIMAFAMQQLPDQEQTVPKEIISELELLEKEIRKTTPKWTRELVTLRRIGGDQGAGWIVLLKHGNYAYPTKPPVKREHLESLQWLSSTRKPFSTSIHNLLKLANSQQNSFVRELAECVLLAKGINMVYRSCHGQVDESNFFSLALSNDEQFRTMLAEPCAKVKLHKRGLLLRLVEAYSGLQLEHDEHVFDGGKLNVKNMKIKEWGYEFGKLELVEIAGSYARYMKDGKLELAAESVLMRTELEEESKAGLVLDHADLLTAQGKHEESLQELQQIAEQMAPFTLPRLRLLTLLVKNHSLLGNESQLLLSFQNLLVQLTFTYGPDTPLHSTLYSILAHFYSTRPQRLNESVNLYHLSLGIVKRLYGENSLQAGDGYVDIAQAYMRAGKWEDAGFSADQAEICYKDSKRKMAEVIALKSKISWKKGAPREAVERIDRAIKVYGKLDRPLELLELYKLRLTYDNDPVSKNQIADSLLELGLSHNNRTLLKKSFELALSQFSSLPRARKDKILDLCSEGDENPTQILPGGEFLTHRKNFRSLAELLKWAADLLEAGPTAEQKAQLVLGEVLGYFEREELEKIFG